jgi:glucose/arabinose dehydrogenase
MRVPNPSVFLTFTLLVTVGACGESRAPVESGFGANPVLPEPQSSLIPTVNIAPAKPWAANAKPVAASGLAVNSFAADLSHPRWIYVLPNGDVLVAETDAPSKPDDSKGIKGMIMKRTMKKAGSGEPSANRITLLRDTDGDGVADTRSVFIEGLNSPFGMTLLGHDFYVADTDAVMKFNYEDGATKIAGPGTRLVDLPAGSINHHWTKNIIASEDGLRLYVTVGSNSNAAENGIAAETNRAGILEIDPATGHSRVYASGLRNPIGMSWNPQTHALWVVVNERDELGNNLVPDYMTSVQENGFYGWPYSYYGQHTDNRVKPMRDDLVAKALKPDYALGAHTASLGLTFYGGSLFPARYSGGAFVGQHGSWNRKPRSGYKVIFVPFADGRPSGAPEDVLTGFLSEDGDAYGRPVGVTVDSKGALLVADDVGNHIWRVTPAASVPAP